MSIQGLIHNIACFICKATRESPNPYAAPEVPSPADILKSSGITVDGLKVTVNYDKANLNIPFLTQPRKVHVYEIPDTNSMDGLFDYGHNIIYLEPAPVIDHQIMVDWIADTWLGTGGYETTDCVYRIMANEDDNPSDFSKSHKIYAIHRLNDVGFDGKGRYFKFK